MMEETAKQSLASTGAAIEAVSPTPTTPVNLIQKIEALGAKLDAFAKAEEAKATTTLKGFLGKHWPWMAGVAAAATRFLHL
jgi:hypothetical protein